MHRKALDDALIAAHQADDGVRIAQLYLIAGDQSDSDGKLDEACFFWVNGYAFALEAGAPETDDLRNRLVRYGRER